MWLHTYLESINCIMKFYLAKEISKIIKLGIENDWFFNFLIIGYQQSVKGIRALGFLLDLLLYPFERSSFTWVKLCFWTTKAAEKKLRNISKYLIAVKMYESEKSPKLNWCMRDWTSSQHELTIESDVSLLLDSICKLFLRSFAI